MAAEKAEFPLIIVDKNTKGDKQYQFIVEAPMASVIPGKNGAPSVVRVEMEVTEPKVPPDGSATPIGEDAFGVFTGDLQKNKKEFLLSVSKIGIKLENLGSIDHRARLVIEFEAPGSEVKPKSR